MKPILEQLQLQWQVENIIEFNLNACFVISLPVIPMKGSQIMKLTGGEENLMDGIIVLAIKLIMSH